MNALFDWLSIVENSLWGYVGFPIIVCLGLYLSVRSRFVQIRKFPTIVGNFVSTFSQGSCQGGSLHPLRAFFASIGGSLGIGNVVTVSVAVTLGGPGTIVWIWVTAIIGALIKYSEVCVSMAHRRRGPGGENRGGPMYFLQDAFSSRWPSILFCVLICLYSVEVYQFGVVTSLTSMAMGVSQWVTALVLLAIIIFVERGGFCRVGLVATLLVPCVVAVYVCMGTYVLVANAAVLPEVLSDIVRSAFSARAAEGAFVGSSLLMTMSHGVRRACYSSDIGVGYASIIHSSSTATAPARQASLLIFEIFMDTFFVCTMSVLLVLVTGTWMENINPLLLVQEALGRYFPHMELFMPCFLSLLGYSVLTTYFSTGMHTMRYLFPRVGAKIYYAYATIAFIVFSFVDPSLAISLMAVIGFFLLMLNAAGIWRLRHSISFDVSGGEMVDDPATIRVFESR